MKFGIVPTELAAGSLLAHSVTDGNGHMLLRKGSTILPDNVQALLAAKVYHVMVAELEAGDISEDESASIVSKAITTPKLTIRTPGTGRALLAAAVDGVFIVDPQKLLQMNRLNAGITIATLPTNTVVPHGHLVALVKIIPFSISEGVLRQFSSLAAQSTAFDLRPFAPRNVALIVAAPPHLQEKLTLEYLHPTQERMQRWHGTITAVQSVDYTPEAISTAISSICRQQVDLILIAGIAAIMDLVDTVPQGLLASGGEITHFGVPVDPGSLLLLGKVSGIPVVGMPSCARSPKPNVIDLILPRLLAGEDVTASVLLELGHGGLMDEIRERPMPRME